MLLLTELRSPGLLGIRSGINCPGTTVAESCGGVDGQIGIHCGLKEDSGPPNPTSVQWLVCAGVLSRFLCPSLWDPMDYSPPGSSVHGISQARILKWVVISFSRGLPNPSLLHCRQIHYHWAIGDILGNHTEVFWGGQAGLLDLCPSLLPTSLYISHTLNIPQYTSPSVL